MATVPSTPSITANSIEDYFEFSSGPELGRGAFSRVVRVINRRDNCERAVKILDRTKLSTRAYDMVTREKEILRRIHHPHIIRLHSCITVDPMMYLEMDLLKEDLFEYIQRCRRVRECDVRVLMQQLMSAVAYLHDIQLIHRDIKPENILINSIDDIRLSDFGLAKILQGWKISATPCGTSFYIAPEIIRSIEVQGSVPLCTNRDDVKFVDLWSCGVVMYALLAGRPPFAGQVKTSTDRRALLSKIDKGVLFTGSLWENVSAEAKDLLSRLLCNDVAHRISASDATKHPFLCSESPPRMIAATDDGRRRTPTPPVDVNVAVVSGAVAPPVSELRTELNTLHEDILHHVDGERDEDNAYKAPTANHAVAPPLKKQVAHRVPGMRTAPPRPPTPQ